jgi:hypothetical protein
MQQEQKKQNSFKNAATKYFGKQTLVTSDIKALLKHTAKVGDSPISNRVGELR